MKILELLLLDKANADIAADMGSTEMCVKNDLRRLMDKSGMGNRVELVLWYMKHYK